MSEVERLAQGGMELAVMVEALAARAIVKDWFDNDEKAEESFDWPAYVDIEVRGWIGRNFDGDQDLAWQAWEETSTDILLVERVWAGNWSVAARESLERLTDAAVEAGVLEERR